MNLLKKIVLILIFFSLTINLSKAEEKVSYVDIDYVLINTVAGKELINILKKEEELKINKFKSNEDNFKNEEKKILAKKNLISKDEINNELQILKVKFQNLGENQAEAHFKWDHISGNYIPIVDVTNNVMPWEVD